MKEGLRTLFGTRTPLTLPLSATGSAGMEAALVNLLEPGDRVVVGVNGVFGGRMAEVARRAGRRGHDGRGRTGARPLDPRPWPTRSRASHRRSSPSSTPRPRPGVCQPVEAIARAAREAGALVVLDCVTSLAGRPVELDAWGIDAAYSGTQKCLSCPPGLSPVSFSERALERGEARASRPVQSWYLDLSLLAGYYGGAKRVYHHTAPITRDLRARRRARPCARGRPAGALRAPSPTPPSRLVAGLEPLGFAPLVAAADRLPMLTSVRLPDRVRDAGDGAVRSTTARASTASRSAAASAPLAGEIWRIGLMGENARPEPVDRLLEALRKMLD